MLGLMKNEKEIQKEFGDGCKIQRYKGLGEMNAEQLWDTTMKPTDQNLTSSSY